MKIFPNRDFVRLPDREDKSGENRITGAEPEAEMRDGYGRPVSPETLDAVTGRQLLALDRTARPNRDPGSKRAHGTHCEVIYWPFARRPETR